ncbi:hypothetical protein RHECIAT_CH0002883 [Rhizobium etli CIAT 652]|uniref:Uncharacterized protein n=1 Tax=Rhizobium etli (strain CIAT 652) TaxID=491916 RepID=B3PT88_RHIE6|nr:hypothetical protein RHECIAT_CH0002883 [Rhizobium etli CIAT 652]
MLSCNWPVPISQVSIEETATGGDVTPEKRLRVLEWLKGDFIENAFIGLIDAIPPQRHWLIERLLDEIRELRRLPSRVGPSD